MGGCNKKARLDLEAPCLELSLFSASSSAVDRVSPLVVSLLSVFLASVVCVVYALWARLVVLVVSTTMRVLLDNEQTHDTTWRRCPGLQDRANPVP